MIQRQILTEEKFRNSVRYIEENPVRRGLVSTPQAYPYSSAARGRLDAMPLHLRTEPAAEIADAIHRLMRSANAVMNRPAVEAGLAAMDAGGDFADGAIVFEGDWLGAEEFVSFDKDAVLLLRSQGKRARVLS